MAQNTSFTMEEWNTTIPSGNRRAVKSISELEDIFGGTQLVSPFYAPKAELKKEQRFVKNTAQKIKENKKNELYNALFEKISEYGLQEPTESSKVWRVKDHPEFGAINLPRDIDQELIKKEFVERTIRKLKDNPYILYK